MENYKPNSHRYKNEQKNQEREKIEKVVTGKVITKKKSSLSKFKDEFISEDAKNVKNYVFGEVLIPAIKKLYQLTISFFPLLILHKESY